MKTIMIFDNCGEVPIQFYVLRGNYMHLDGVYVNSTKCKQKLQDEITNLMYDAEGNTKLKPYKRFPIKTACAGAPIIVAGFLP